MIERVDGGQHHSYFDYSPAPVREFFWAKGQDHEDLRFFGFDEFRCSAWKSRDAG